MQERFSRFFHELERRAHFASARQGWFQDDRLASTIMRRSQSVGVLRSCLPASLCRAPVGGPGFPHTDAEHVRALAPHFGCFTTACVSSPWDLAALHWLAHAAGHGHFQGAFTSGRTVPVSHRVHVWKARYDKLAIVLLETWLSFVTGTTRVFRAAGRILHSGVSKTRKITEFFACNRCATEYCFNSQLLFFMSSFCPQLYGTGMQCERKSSGHSLQSCMFRGARGVTC